MIDPDFVDEVLESEWVRQKLDENGKETWGHELIEGAPPDITAKFNELQALFGMEREAHGYK